MARAWKLERATVHKRAPRPARLSGRQARGKPRSNKYSGGDTGPLPKPHKRKQIWVGGHTRRSGKKIKGYFRTNSQYRSR